MKSKKIRKQKDYELIYAKKTKAELAFDLMSKKR
jgi:hypothetical protein